MKKTITKLLCTTLVLLIGSCQLVDDVFDPGSDEERRLQANKINTELNLPMKSKLDLADLYVSSFSEKVKVTAPDSGRFEIAVSESEKPQVLFATNSNNNPVLLGVVDPVTKKGEVSARSTAKSLVFMNPVFLLTSADQRSQIMSEAAKHPEFQNLVASIENLLETDPEHVLDIAIHPMIYEKAAEISLDLLKNGGITDLKSASVEKKSPWLESYQKNEISILNPKTIYFAAEFTPRISEQNTHLIMAKSSLVSVGLTWPPVYFTEPTVNTFAIKTNDTYQLDLTKGFDFSTPSELFNARTANGKATLANTGKSLGLIFDLVIGLDLPVTGLLDIAIDSKKNLEICIRMGNHFMDGDVFGIVFDVCDFTVANKDEIFFWIRQELNPMNADKLDERLAHAFSIMKNVAIATKVISIGSKAANEIIPFVNDLISTDRTLQYTFTVQNGELTGSGINTPPEITSAQLLKNELSVNTTLHLHVKGEDIENDEIAYRIHWGNGSASNWSAYQASGSGTDFTYSYSEPGIYQIVVEAKDIHGATGELSGQIPISIYSADDHFVYDFENDLTGTHPSSPPWQISETTPSYLRVANNNSNGTGRSCEFIDYDPDIVNNDQDGGVATIILNNKLKNSGTVQFSCKVANKQDNFGIRTWQDDNYRWSEMGFYLSFHDGNLCYYIGGTFHKLMETTPDKWYAFQIDYNTSLKKYNITIDGKIVAQNIDYSGNPSGLSQFQVVAFSDASCRKANIDQIVVPVEYLKSGIPVTDVPAHATTLSH